MVFVKEEITLVRNFNGFINECFIDINSVRTTINQKFEITISNFTFLNLHYKFLFIACERMKTKFSVQLISNIGHLL